jgi:predicted short-subunit dehydrogenase-like oxidoreductase (DUF2520 family)
MEDMRIGFVGAGKAGCSFGKLIAGCEALSVSGYLSRTHASAEYAAGLTASAVFESPGDLLSASDAVFLTVPEGAIAHVWEGLRERPEARGKLFCHMSGSLTSALFGGADGEAAAAPGGSAADDKAAAAPGGCAAENARPGQRGRDNLYGSLHPVLAIADRETAWHGLADAHYTFEGSDAAYLLISPMFKALSLRVERIEAEANTLYHAACVFASNLVCGLAYDAERLLRECGLSDEFAAGAWKMLFAGNADNIIKSGPVAALTGPAERGDRATIENHVAALKILDSDAGETMRDTYDALTKTLMQMAALRHPERD